MKTIIFPTDFSDNSLQAFPYALDMAFLLGVDLILFNAYRLPYSKSNLLVSILDRIQKDAEEELEKLKKKALADAKYKRLKITTLAWSGALVSSIHKLTHSHPDSLIVMGTKGADGLRESFIGSNTLEVIQATHCPVIAIPENAHNNKIEKIAMATDLKKFAHKEQLFPLIEMAKIAKASIEFVHVVRPQEEREEGERAYQMDKLLGLTKDVPTSVHFITDSDIINGLSEYIQNRKPGMLAMLSRKHTLFERLFLKSITHKLSFRTEIPLLVMDE